jgi:hypothetical protein
MLLMGVYKQRKRIEAIVIDLTKKGKSKAEIKAEIKAFLNEQRGQVSPDLMLD